MSETKKSILSALFGVFFGIAVLFAMSFGVLAASAQQEIGGAEAQRMVTHKVAFVYSYDLASLMDAHASNDRTAYIKKNFPEVEIRSYFFNFQRGQLLPKLAIEGRAEWIKQRVTDFAPDFVVVVDPLAFEHFYLPYVVKEKRFAGMFSCIDEDPFRFACARKGVDPERTDLTGVVMKSDMDKFKLLFTKIGIKNVYIVSDKSNEEDERTVERTKAMLEEFEVEAFYPKTTDELASVIQKLDKRPRGVIIDVSDRILNAKGVASDMELVAIYRANNRTHLEIKLHENWTEHGLAMSCFHYTKPKDLLDEETVCNKQMRAMLYKENPSKVIKQVHHDVIVHKDRIFDLQLDELIDKHSRMFDLIWE